MMNVEIREDSVVLTGYVNSVERYSKPIKSKLHGSFKTFVERIKAGAFKNALKKNDNVKVLLNHNYQREVANTKDGTAILDEDNIGLRAEVTIKDEEVIEKAKNGKLSGWSFGFIANDDTLGFENGIESRTVNDLELYEVSILDDTRNPAYYGTSVETRSDEELEFRENLLEESEDNSSEIEERMIEKITNKILEKLNTLNINTVVEDEKEEYSKEIDYSSYEKRLEKL